MGAKREYVAIFSIGARLLGSFRGAFAAAQARMKRLQATAMAAGRSMMRFGSMFGALFTGLAAFGAFKLFSKVFQDATAEIEEQHDRERKLQAMLMANNEIRKKGVTFAKAQKDLVIANNTAMAKTGLVTADMYDVMAANLAQAGLMPKEIMKMQPALADALVAMKGINVSEGDAANAAFMMGKAITLGVAKPMAKLLPMMTKEQAKAFPKMSMKARYDLVMKLMAAMEGVNKEALKDPGAQVKKLNEDLSEMAETIGKQVLPAKDKVASVWRSLIPEIQPHIEAMQQLSVDAQMAIAEYAKETLLPALKRFSAWAKGDGAKAWEKIKAAWKDMTGKIGKALGDQFKSLAGNGRSLGDVVVSAMEAIADAMKWVGNNAKWIVPALEALAVSLGAIAAFGVISTNIKVLGIAAAIGAIAKVTSEYQKFKDLQAGIAVSDPEHFTKHWYLMNQTWSEVFGGLEAVVHNFKEGWDKSINELKAKWDWLVESIRLFKMPDWWNKFWARQASEQEKSAAHTGALAEQEAGRVAEAERLLAIQKQWAAHRGPSAAEIAVAQGMAPPFLSGGTAGRGRGPILPPIARGGPATRAPGVPQPWVGGGVRGMPPVAGVQESVAEILPFWKRTAETVQDDWRRTMKSVVADTGTIQPGLEQTGENLKKQILTPIQEIMRNWSLLSTAMGTPLSIPAAAAAAATGPGGLPVPDIPPDTTGVPGLAGGGIVRKPTLAMIGERGPEAVTPLRRGAGATSVNFAPVVTINGNASAAEQAALDRTLRDLSRDFVADFKRAQANERRLSYEGGYG